MKVVGVVENGLQARIGAVQDVDERMESLDWRRRELRVAVALGVLSCRVALRASLKTALRVIVLKKINDGTELSGKQVSIDELTLEIDYEETVDDCSLKVKLRASPHSRLSVNIREFCQPSPKPFSATHFQDHDCQTTISYPHYILNALRKAKMINAVLVFNNAGQPRLTKFYTQLVRPLPPPSNNHLTGPGNICPTTSHLRNLPTSIPPPDWLLQLPPPPTSPRASAILSTVKFNPT